MHYNHVFSHIMKAYQEDFQLDMILKVMMALNYKKFLKK